MPMLSSQNWIQLGQPDSFQDCYKMALAVVQRLSQNSQLFLLDIISYFFFNIVPCPYLFNLI